MSQKQPTARADAMSIRVALTTSQASLTTGDALTTKEH